MHESLSELPVDERDRVYSAAELIDLALAGHFCIRKTIDSTIHRIDREHGRHGRERMCGLPGLKAYATEEEIDTWQERLLTLADQLEAETRAARTRVHDDQPGLFDSSNLREERGGS